MRLETGQHTNVPENERTCSFCNNVVESEVHVLVNCPVYCSLREPLFTRACSSNPNFSNQCDTEKFKFMFTHPDMTRVLAKTCFNVLKLRNNILYCKNNVHDSK